MKSFLIIGMGSFGHHLCRKLAEHKCEIMVVDQESSALEDILPLVVSARVADCTKLEVLKTFGISQFDVCFVCIGSHFQSCLEITDLLNELGAKKILCKVDRDIDAKFLMRNGADGVIYPERDIATRIAVSMSSDHIFDFIALSEDYSIYEISVRPEWVGKTLSELDFRTAYHLNLIASKMNGVVSPVLHANYTLSADEHIFVLGSLEDIRRATD